MNSSQIVTLVVLAGLSLFSLFKFYQYFMLQRKAAASQSWPETTATVTESGTAYSRSSKGGKQYRAEIGYSYTVLGTAFPAQKKIYSLFGAQGTAEKDAAKYPVGSSFPLRYNPEKPAECISELEKGGTSNLALAIIFLVLALFMVYVNYLM